VLFGHKKRPIILEICFKLVGVGERYFVSKHFRSGRLKNLIHYKSAKSTRRKNLIEMGEYNLKKVPFKSLIDV